MYQDILFSLVLLIRKLNSQLMSFFPAIFFSVFQGKNKEFFGKICFPNVNLTNFAIFLLFHQIFNIAKLKQEPCSQLISFDISK
jgi:hypothetical protein